MNLRLYVNYYMKINGLKLNLGSIFTHFCRRTVDSNITHSRNLTVQKWYSVL